MDVIRAFDEVWNKFMVICRAKLMEKSRQNILNFSAAQMAIQDAISIWFDPYEACGEWLKSLKREYPDAENRIRVILQEIKLEEIPHKKVGSEHSALGVAAAGAALGTGAGYWFFHFGTVGTVLSAIIPAALLFPAIKGFQKTEKDRIQKEEILEYLNQLYFVKEEIEGILNCIAISAV